MPLRRPPLGAPWDSRLTAPELARLLSQGPRPFVQGQDVDLFDAIEAHITSLLVAPTAGGLTYAPALGTVDLPASAGPAWPLTASGGASVAVVDGQAVLSGAGLVYSSAPLAPVPPGRTCSALVEFQVTAQPGQAVALDIGGLSGTVAQPGSLTYPVELGRGWTRANTSEPTAPPVGAVDRLDVLASRGVAVIAGAFDPVQRVPFGQVLLGRWYRLELLARTSARESYTGDQGLATLYDAQTGETVATTSYLYSLAAPRLGLRLGTPANGTPAAGYTASTPTVTVRRWQEWRPARAG